MIKMKDIMVLILVMLISFPVLLFVILIYTGNARIEFGPLKKAPEQEKQVQIVRQSAKAESLAVVNSKTYQALQQEREEMAAERQKLQEEKAQLELFQRDLESQKDAVKKEREKIEGLVSRSDSLEKKKTAQLSKMYAAMRPAEAAQIIGTLQDELASKIIDGIGDDRQKAKILAALPAEKATKITQLMGGTSKK